MLRKWIKIGAKFYQHGAPVWQAPLKLVTMILLPYVNKHTERGGVLRLHVSEQRNQKGSRTKTYLIERKWEPSMQTLMMKKLRGRLDEKLKFI